ncbi:alpha/beta fold hydrolase [Microbacterium ulmi]|uniref:Alpha/beta hydrolase n=1 Tax=Microbacterium ulmi TaxID=179095 RepID=A0A7Y2Q135_9MICO|nr:alpha/beta hydrolase [Microbacterium ulmi]NII68944.1 pimeloyl-ACP methyl ester carboxylesterase [Microbacterium ulmi]NNH03927.1 alpha/beta hydrolase [Microbacterium ulmi]
MNPWSFVTKDVEAGELRVAYVDEGDPHAEPVVLLHGFPYDVHSYADVVPLLVDAGFRVVVPHLRGHGATRFLDDGAERSGQQAALGADLLALLDALGLDQPILAGYDWGGRAACVVAALWPERVAGLVSVNGYLIQDIAASATPLRPDLEAGFWYFWYFATERGRRGLELDRRGIADVIWRRNSPEWRFTDAELERAAAAFDNPDYVDIVIHSYRHRLGLSPGSPRYEQLERRLADQPAIVVPTITLDGTADGNFPATDGSQHARLFTGYREHRQVVHAGHHLPAEAPHAFAEAILDIAEPPGDGAGTP